MVARSGGEEAEAEARFREGLALAEEAAQQAAKDLSTETRLECLRLAARLALHCGEAAAARGRIDEARRLEPATAFADEWMALRDLSAWPDAWLIAAVRRDPPDEKALDALVERFWKVLFGRCQMLTLNAANAADLAQDAWRRVLRARHRLNPGGHFAAYLITIATNLWRDHQRSAVRAGPLAENRLASLNESISAHEDDGVTLMDALPDLRASDDQARRMLALDLDQALGRLAPLLREVLVARYLNGESCAEIGKRHGRTEQTISGWVRAAIQQMKMHLKDTKQPTKRGEAHES